MKELKLNDTYTCSKCGNKISVGTIRYIPTKSKEDSQNRYIKVYCPECNDYVKMDRYAISIDGAVTVAFAKDDKMFADTYFTDKPEDSEFKLTRSFDSWKEFIEYWDEMHLHPEGMWYYVIDELDGCVLSGAVDPSDREIFEKYLEEEAKMNATTEEKKEDTRSGKEIAEEMAKDKIKEEFDNLMNESSPTQIVIFCTIQIMLDSLLAMRSTDSYIKGVVKKIAILASLGTDLRRDMAKCSSDFDGSVKKELIEYYMKRFLLLKNLDNGITTIINKIIAVGLSEMVGMKPEELPPITEEYLSKAFAEKDVTVKQIEDLNAKIYKEFEKAVRGTLASYMIINTRFENSMRKMLGNQSIPNESSTLVLADDEKDTEMDEELDRAMQAEMSEGM